jgi:hypothetical protein
VYISSLSTDFYLQAVELVLVYNSSPALDFHLQKKNVSWHIYDMCPQILICSRQRNMYWCTGGPSLQDVYLQQTKESILNARHPDVFLMTI